MMEILIDPARRSGCEDIQGLEKVIEASSLRQKSPLDDILDANVVDEEKYLRELAHDIGMEWLESIPPVEHPLPLRELCGPRIALRHRLLPIAIIEDGEKKTPETRDL